MTVPCIVSIDGGTPQLLNPVGTVILQGTTSATTPLRILRFELAPSQIGGSLSVYPASNVSLTVQFGYYSVGQATGGLTPVGIPINEGLLGLYTPQTSFVAMTTSLGAAFVPLYSWFWDNSRVFGLFDAFRVNGPGSPTFDTATQVKQSLVWAFVIPAQFISPLQQPFYVTGTLAFEEFH
jgi:hypothetical protein